MFKKIILAFLLHMNIVRSFTSSMIIPSHDSCLIRKIIINDNKMPSIYTSYDFDCNKIKKNTFLTAEHIYPQSFLNEYQAYDMHNIVRTLNTLNVNRSNYKFHDFINETDKHWNKLEYDNYVNHKKKLFVPNSNSRGLISRAILYMCKEYGFKINKIIDKPTLIKWYYTYCPTREEIYHNAVVKYYQNRNNIFISKYNKKNIVIKKYIAKL